MEKIRNACSTVKRALEDLNGIITQAWEELIIGVSRHVSWHFLLQRDTILQATFGLTEQSFFFRVGICPRPVYTRYFQASWVDERPQEEDGWSCRCGFTTVPSLSCLLLRKYLRPVQSVCAIHTYTCIHTYMEIHAAREGEMGSRLGTSMQ